MNSNYSVKINQLSTQLNNEQLQDVMGGILPGGCIVTKPGFPRIPSPTFPVPPRYPEIF
ncbi:MAG: hypothetical protein ACRC2R_22585 [Xenococcaceae cyanobacterium]